MSGSDLPVGCELLGYRVERLLGRGGMGVVYLAEDVRLRRSVALKVLAPSLAEDGRFRERFLAESKLAASLDHPCVIPIYEAGESGGLLFIAMRYVDGGDLKALLGDGLLTAERAVRLCAQVADALDFAHGRGLVHGDVKPSNVLLDGREHVYLADFGLTKRLGEPQAAEPGVLGTIDYAAPEQIRGEKVDGRADQYSLACLLYECLVGAPPFPRSTDAAVLFAHLEEPPPALPGLEDVMRTGLAKSPEDRYGSCAALVLAAAEALGIVGGAQSRLPELPFLLAGVVCPFKGLAFFDRSDAEYFCGRETVVSEVVARLAASTLVGIIGPSGIGKSSLLRAGVLPALSAGVLPGSAAWRQVLLRPGTHPGAELTRALGGEELGTAVARMAPGERMVVAIDQLEELFTGCENEPERAAFLEELWAAARDPDRRVLVLGSLRADFYGRVASYPAFAQLLSADHVLVGPMDHDALAHAIAEPASRAGLELEQPLFDALVADVAGETGGLPLLSTMLLELWQVRDGRTLRYESYRASGGVHGAVARLAERAFAELEESERAVARSVMLRLVSDQDGVPVRRRARLSELNQVEGAERVLATLTGARLLTVSDGKVEVSHEALLQEWPRCRDWLEEDRVGRSLHAHLATTAQEWDARGRDPGDLYRGARLAGAQNWAAHHGVLMTALERDFLSASDQEAHREARQQRAQNRRLRRVAAGAGLLFVLALAAGVFAEIQKRSADQHRRTAQSLQLATSAQATLAADPELSTLLALQGLRVTATGQAVQALRDALSQVRMLATLRAGRGATSATFSPDGKQVATVSEDGVGRIWSTDNHKQVAVLSAPRGVSITNVAFSADGLEIVTPQSDGTARIWSAGSHRPLAALRARRGGPMWSAAFSSDGHKIVTAGIDGTVRIWGRTSLRPLVVLTGARGGALNPALSPDGEKIITASGRDATARVFSTTGGNQLSVITSPGGAPLDSAAFSPDGKEIVTSSADGTARIWSAERHRQLAAVTEPGNNRLYSATFSPDGKEIVTASQDRTARVWSARTGKQLLVLAGHTSSVVSAAFSSNGLTVVTSSLDGTAKLWNATPLEQLSVMTEPANAKLVRATFAGKRVVTVSVDGAARIWSTRGYGKSRLLTTPDGGPVDIAVSPDATKWVTIGRRGSAQVWSASSHTQVGVLRVPGGASPRTAAFSPDGKEIVTLGGRRAQIWSTSSDSLLGVLSDPGVAPLVTVAFSRDHHQIVGIDENGNIQIWSARSDTLLGAISVPPTVGLNGAGFSPDGQKIVTAGYDGTARIWSTASHRQIRALTEPDSSELRSAEFSPDGTKIVTASADGTARIWGTHSHDQLTVVTEFNNAPLNSAAFSPDGTEIVTASDDGTARIWSTELSGPISAIRRIAETRVTRQLTPDERKTYLAGM